MKSMPVPIVLALAGVGLLVSNVCATPINVASSYAQITIDGSFSDWAGVSLAYSQAQPAGATVAFQNVYVANDDNYLYLRFSLYSSANPFTSKQNIFVDADTNAATGYSEHGLGSELLVQSGKGYQEKNGIFNAATINGLDWAASPAGAGSEFEVRISRNATYTNGAPVFANSTVALFLESSETAGNEWFPNVSGGMIYTFATATATTNTLTVSLTSPTNGVVFDRPANIPLSATVSDSGGNVTNAAFYNGTALLANVTAAPYTFMWTNVPVGSYALSAVARDDNGAASGSGVAYVTVANRAVLQQIKTVFVIALENHDFTQSVPDASPQQLFGNPAAPYFNSLITAGYSNAAQVSYAARYYSVCKGAHPSEMNYVWSEAGTSFGIFTDNDPEPDNTFTGQHLTGQMDAAGISWKSYQEDVQYAASPAVSAGGSSATNVYNGSTYYSYVVKHDPMEFFTDTQNENIYPFTKLWTDLAANTVGRYNWITPDSYNEMHSYLPTGFLYQGTQFAGDQAAIAEGDNCLSVIIPRIMASQAYQDHGVIIIWMDETVSTDDTNTTLPLVVISPLAKGNAYAGSLAYNHSSTLKTMDEIFGLAFQTNAIPASCVNAFGTGYNYVNGAGAAVNDLSDLFQTNVYQPPSVIGEQMTLDASGFQLTFSGPDGQPYEVLASDDLTIPQSAWTVISSGTFNGTNVVFDDNMLPVHSCRFYVIKSP